MHTSFSLPSLQPLIYTRPIINIKMLKDTFFQVHFELLREITKCSSNAVLKTQHVQPWSWNWKLNLLNISPTSVSRATKEAKLAQDPIKTIHPPNATTPAERMEQDIHVLPKLFACSMTDLPSPHKPNSLLWLLQTHIWTGWYLSGPKPACQIEPVKVFYPRLSINYHIFQKKKKNPAQP